MASIWCETGLAIATPDEVTRDSVGRGVPVLPGVGFFDEVEIIGVMADGEGGRVTVALEIHVVGMRIEKDHTALLGNPGGFLFPNRVARFAEEKKECRVLRESVGELDVATSI